MATFIHTADWELCDPTVDMPGPTQAKWGLLSSDYELIRRVGEVARENNADFVLVVGRVFSSAAPSRDVIAGAIRAIAEIGLPVVIVPGGRDDERSGSVWEDAFFIREAANWAPNLRVLLSNELVEQEGCFPCLLCPLVSCDSESSLRDGWAELRERLAANGRWSRPLSGMPPPRIMILPDLARAGEQDSAVAAFLGDAVLAEIDYVALAGGDGVREVAPKAWHAGSPGWDTIEPAIDESDRHEAGHVAVVTVWVHGEPPTVTAAPTSWRIQEPIVAHAPGPESPPPTDDNVQFTVFRPQVVASAKWYDLVAAAHLDAARPDADPAEPSPLDRVQAKAQALLGERFENYATLTHDALQGVPQGGELTFAFEMPGVEFNPARVSFGWWEDEHTVQVRLRASPTLEGTTARGRMTVFLGAIILADVPFSLRVDSSRAADRPRLEPEREAVRRYRRIFASYSHRDLPIVEQFEAFVEATGDRYLRDHKVLRAGEAWDDRLLELIAEADVFQLFWSRNALASPHVRREWEHALSLGRDNFIRPVYWESPLPKAEGLPPEPLTRIHFQFLGGIASAAAACEATAAGNEATAEAVAEAHDVVGVAFDLADEGEESICFDTDESTPDNSSADLASTATPEHDLVGRRLAYPEPNELEPNEGTRFFKESSIAESEPRLGYGWGILIGLGIGLVAVPIVIWLVASLLSLL